MSPQLKITAFLLAVLIPVALFLVVYGWTNPSENPPGGGGVLYYDSSTGRVGISNTNPQYKLHVSGDVGANTFLGSISASNITSGTFGSGNFSFPVSLGVGTTTTTFSTKLYVEGNAWITGKLTVSTIDPIYLLGGKNYATYVASMTGVKEETTGKGRLAISSQQSAVSNFYEYIIDFENLEKGSDLWLWYRTIDFSKDNVEVLITPYGEEASIYYLIDESKLIFRGNKPVEFSYRLTGKRHDWRDWPNEISD